MSTFSNHPADPHETDDPLSSLHLFRYDLEQQGKTESTINLYLTVARLIERHAASRTPPVELEFAAPAELIDTAESWAASILAGRAAATRRAYLSAARAFLKSLDPTGYAAAVFHCPLPLGEMGDRLRWAGREKPSSPLTGRQLARLRRKSVAAGCYPWGRTAVELALAGLTYAEIRTVNVNQFSSYLDPPRLTLADRTVPVHDRLTAEWLASCRARHFPASGGEGGKPVSLRLLKQEISRLVAGCRDRSRGTHQGIRALHNTGAGRRTGVAKTGLISR